MTRQRPRTSHGASDGSDPTLGVTTSHSPERSASHRRMNRVRWFEVILIGYVVLWLWVIWSAGDPPRFFL